MHDGIDGNIRLAKFAELNKNDLLRKTKFIIRAIRYNININIVYEYIL